MFNFLFQGKVGEMMAPIKSPEAQLLIAIHNRHHDKVRELLEVQGVSANSANERGVRPMHMACQCGDMALVQRLLELGADIVSTDKAGNAPLHYAAKYGHMELVKVLVSQGAAVEGRNSSRMTAYDVATDHIVRQYLLPLQLKAEAGNPDYAVHHPGITTDAPRNFEQYGVPEMGTMGGLPSGPQGHPYGHHNVHAHGAGDASASDAMNAALGALMQPAASIAPPRPPASSVPPVGISGPPGLRPGSYSPPGAGFPASSPPSALPTTLSTPMASPPGASSTVPPHPLPTPGVTMSSMATFSGAGSHGSSLSPSPPVPAGLAAAAPEPSNASGESSAGSPGGEISGTRYPGVGVAGEAPPEVPSAAEPTSALTEAPGATSTVAPPAASIPTPVSAPAETSVNESSTLQEIGLSSAPSGEDLSVPVAEDDDANAVEVVAKDVVGHSSPSAELTGGVPAKTQSGAAVGGWARRPEAAGAEVIGTSSIAPEQSLNGKAGGVSVNLSASFEAQAAVSALPRSVFNPPALAAEPRAPTQMANPRQGPPAGEKLSFKPIKADGFHSSASDKALQERYGHTKIVRDLGAPPTAAQLGPLGSGPIQQQGGYGTTLPAHPMFSNGSYGQVQPPAGNANAAATASPPRPPTQYMARGSSYAQPFGSGPSYGQQPYGLGAPQVQLTPARLPSASSSHKDVHGRAPQQGPFASVRVPASMPMASVPHAERQGSSTAPAAATGSSGLNSAPPAAVYIFNPTTDRVVAADSTSSSVL